MPALVIWIAMLSLVTLAAYGIDKVKAKRNAWRIPESALHGLALAGGFAGGWLGMFLFRHKTRKPMFKIVLAASTVIWLVIAWWVLG